MREFAKLIHQSLIRFPVFRREPRDYVAEVGFVELRIFADLTREETLAQRAEWDESDAEFFECRYDFGLGFSPPQRVFALQGGDGLNFVGATDGLNSCFRKSKVLDLALLD